MAVAKVFTNGNIVNGRATISIGQGAYQIIPTGEIYHDDPSREQVFPQVTGSVVLDSIDGRYLQNEWYTDGFIPSMSSGDVSTPAAGYGALVYYGAVPYRRHVIGGVNFSYDAVPPSGTVCTVESPSGTVLFSEQITNTGPGFFIFGDDGSKEPVANTELLVRLTPPASGSRCQLTVRGHWMQ